MFTGIVQTLAEVFNLDSKENLLTLSLKVPKQWAKNLELGASIAINGVCLTVVSFDSEVDDSYTIISFDIIEESLRVTNLGAIKQGDKVNLERSLKMGDELGGHVVSGHIQTKAQLMSIRKTETNCQLVFSYPSQWQKYLFDKGFVAINGVSLTLGKVTNDSFDVHLIPETLARTNLSLLTLQDYVNLEFDQQTITIVKTIERMKLT